MSGSSDHILNVIFQQGTIDLEVMFVAPDEDSDEGDPHDFDDENHFRSVYSGRICT